MELQRKEREADHKLHVIQRLRIVRTFKSIPTRNFIASIGIQFFTSAKMYVHLGLRLPSDRSTGLQSDGLTDGL
jgi:hypothetical protein